MITVKDLAMEMKKTSGEVSKNYSTMVLWLRLITRLILILPFLVAEEFGITATKKEEVKEEDIPI